MEPDGSQTRFIVSVDDLSNVWGVLKPSLEARSTWKNLQLRNRVGGHVSIPELRVRYMESSNPRLQQLRQNSQSPVTWFRNPYVQLILISSEDQDEYKKMLKNQLKQAIDVEKDMLGGAPELVIACLQPPASDPNFKAAKKVYDSIRSDIGTKKRDRVVRIEVGPRRSVAPASINDLEKQMAEALKLTFSIRQAAYDDAVRKLTSERQAAGWEFGDLFLVKDSLAVMLESAGLYDDALREYAELDALYNTTLPPLGSASSPPFGATSPGDDTAQLVRATWREARKTVWRNNELLQFDFQQFLFACQARILLRLNKPAEVAERGVIAIEGLQRALGHTSVASKLPALFKEAWIFSACISLANETVRVGPPPPTPKAQTPLLGHSRTESMPQMQQQRPSEKVHRRTTSDMHTSQNAAVTRLHRQTKSLNTHFPTISEGSTGEGSGKSDGPSEADSDDESEVQYREIQASDRDVSLESSTSAKHRARLKPVRTKLSDTREPALQDPAPNGQLHGQSSAGSSAHQSASSIESSTDWQLGVQGYMSTDGLNGLAGEHSQMVEANKSSKQRHFWILLGHLYAQARDALSAFNDSVDMQSSIASTPMGTVESSRNSSLAQSPLPQRSPSLRTGPSLGHILPSLESLGLAPARQSSLSSEVSRASTVVDGQSSRTPAENAGGASHHFRSLSRFAREAATRSGQASSLFHHSRKPSATSEVPNTPMSESDSVGNLLQRDPESSQPEVLLKNVRLVERDVETASESSNSPNSAKQSERFGSNKSKFGWLTEWRVRTAIASVAKYQELWIELSGAAAACYAAAGWQRQAHLMMAGVADVLVQKGQLQMAISLMQNSSRHLLSEGWLHLSAHLQALQLECHQDLGKSADPEECLRLLGLSQLTQQEESAQMWQEVFVESAGGSLPRVLTDPHVFWAEPIGSHFSRFFGQSTESGEPVAIPSRKPPCPGLQVGSGAQQAYVGDVLTVHILVNSSLPGAIHIQSCQLILSILQEVTVVLSPRAASGPDTSWTRGHGHLRSASVRSMDSMSTLPLAPRGSKDSGNSSSTSLFQDPMGSQKFGSRWQTTEEVVCELTGGGSLNSSVKGDHGSISSNLVHKGLTLQPGPNLLKFKVTPLKRGLFALKHVTLHIGSLECRAPAKSKIASSPGIPETSQKPRGILGSCSALGELEEEAVMIEVQGASQRVKTSALLPHLVLISGAKQWVGLSIRPMHDSLYRAVLHVQPIATARGHKSGCEAISLYQEGDKDAWLAPEDTEGGPRRFPWQISSGEKTSTSGRQSEASNTGPAAQRWDHTSSDYGRLPSWAANKPSVLWLPVRAGQVSSQRQKVRVSSYASQIPLKALQSVADMTSPVTSPLRSPDAEAFQKTGQARGIAHMEVNIQYEAGCPRGSSSCLELPVLPALRVHIVAKEAPGQKVLLQVFLTSNVSSPTTVLSYSLTPQPGFAQESGMDALLPLEIPANGVATLLILLSVANSQVDDLLVKRGSRLESSLELTYQPHLERLPSTAYQEHDDGPSKAKPLALAISEEQLLSQQHDFILDLGAASSAPLSTVYIRLLGPFSARPGEAVTFCWRLERSSNFEAGKGDSNVLQYSIRLEGDGWREAGVRHGSVQLLLQPGSIATVEATWTPHSPGMLAMPQFVLPDVPHQEVFDVGDANHLLTVS